MKNQAFTLIELLVVVLIIGILAAVALPQYQTAVNKSRYAGLMPLARSVKDAEEAVFMTKNDYTADLEDLGVQAGAINPANTATQGNVTLTVVAGAGEGQDYVKAVDSRNTDNTFVMYFAKSPKYPGEIHCEALTANTKAQQLCKSYGPVGTVTGTDNTYTTYVLQGTGTDAGSIGGGAGGCGNDCWNNTVMSNTVAARIKEAAYILWGSDDYLDDEIEILDENTLVNRGGPHLVFFDPQTNRVLLYGPGGTNEDTADEIISKWNQNGNDAFTWDTAVSFDENGEFDTTWVFYDGTWYEG